jgi:SAM-dependent methyltransferase
MSHPEQVAYFRAVAQANNSLIKGGSVLEVGSYDVNGTIRSIFSECSTYVGIDLTPGPGVDQVGYGHEYGGPDGAFDISISGECFEHDQNWVATLTNMVRLTRPGGLVAFSCASRGRPEHGTLRTRSELSPGTQALGDDYYRNLTAADFGRALDLPAMFSQWKFWFLPTHCDLYFAGVRAETTPGAADASIPTNADVMKLVDVMPVMHRVIRLPLKVVARTRVGEQRFQDLTYRYWNLLLALAGESSTRRTDR